MDEEGYSVWFYFWLVVGIVGVVGFITVAAGIGG